MSDEERIEPEPEETPAETVDDLSGDGSGVSEELVDAAPEEPGSFLRRRGGVIVVAVLAVLGFAAGFGFTVVSSDSVPTGVGSCWTGVEVGEDAEAVDCDDERAAETVTAEVTDPEQCREADYLEHESNYLCLAPLP